MARIYENSLSGIANKYVVLEPGTGGSAEDPRRRLDRRRATPTRRSASISSSTRFDPATRRAWRASSAARRRASTGAPRRRNQTLRYFAPALASTTQVTAELARSEPTFDGLLVQGAQAMQALGTRTQELTSLVANTNAATAAHRQPERPLQQTLSLAPGALNHTVRTFAGLREHA